MPACITTTRASQPARATPATTRSHTCGGPSNCSHGSARTRAEMTTSPLYATTLGSRRLFAERVGLDPRVLLGRVTFPHLAHRGHSGDCGAQPLPKAERSTC